MSVPQKVNKKKNMGYYEMRMKLVKIWLCEACLNGEGKECHSPGCALWMHDSPGHLIMPELYEVLKEYDVDTFKYRGRCISGKEDKKEIT